VVASCTTAGGDGCVEYGTANQELQTTCTNEGGTHATAACSRTGAVGGCRQGGGGGCVTTWWYASSGVTTEQVQLICSQTGGTFVSP
jgi:hypothetical protein